MNKLTKLEVLETISSMAYNLVSIELLGKENALLIMNLEELQKKISKVLAIINGVQNV
jgi:hypothetical protein